MLPSLITEFINTELKKLTQKNHELRSTYKSSLKLEEAWLGLLTRSLEFANEQNFSSVDPLGEIYEYFLENELELNQTTIHIRQREKKQKTRGVVYTPLKIVQLMCEISAELNFQENSGLSGHNAGLRIGDISCGSGRFLLGWHLQSEQKQQPNHTSSPQMYGFDIDPIALRIAKYQFIPNTIFIQKDPLIENDEELEKGFDLIIGNPPYIESRAIPDSYWKVLRERYNAAYKKFDIAVVFLERIIQLLKPGGYGCYIISNKWLVSDYGEKVREQLLSQTRIRFIIDISQLNVFNGTSIYPIIIFFQKISGNVPGKQEILIYRPDSLQELYQNSTTIKQQLQNNSSTSAKFIRVSQTSFLNSPHFLIALPSLNLNSHNLSIFQDLKTKLYFYLNSEQSPYELHKGIHTGNVKQKIVTQDSPPENSNYKKLLTSRERVERYSLQWQGLWIHYNPDLIDRKKGEYGSFREPWIFESSPKILIKLFGKRLNATIDLNSYYANNSIILLVKNTNQNTANLEIQNIFDSIEEEFYYLLGILNSQPVSDFYHLHFSATQVRGGFLQYYIRNLAQIPIAIPTRANKAICQQIAVYAKQLATYYSSNMNKRNQSPKTEIKTIEELLNQAVEQLYMSIKQVSQQHE
jgi:SAM-dependent methyltransferase